jgi:hypothetical protein
LEAGKTTASIQRPLLMHKPQLPASVNPSEKIKKGKPIDEPTEPMHGPGEPIHAPLPPPLLRDACILAGPRAPPDLAFHCRDLVARRRIWTATSGLRR